MTSKSLSLDQAVQSVTSTLSTLLKAPVDSAPLRDWLRSVRAAELNEGYILTYHPDARQICNWRVNAWTAMFERTFIVAPDSAPPFNGYIPVAPPAPAPEPVRDFFAQPNDNLPPRAPAQPPSPSSAQEPPAPAPKPSCWNLQRYREEKARYKADPAAYFAQWMEEYKARKHQRPQREQTSQRTRAALPTNGLRSPSNEPPSRLL
jgi:hypothetical protein